MAKWTLEKREKKRKATHCVLPGTLQQIVEGEKWGCLVHEDFYGPVDHRPVFVRCLGGWLVGKFLSVWWIYWHYQRALFLCSLLDTPGAFLPSLPDMTGQVTNFCHSMQTYFSYFWLDSDDPIIMWHQDGIFMKSKINFPAKLSSCHC